MSKLDALKSFAHDLSTSCITVDAIAIQETWSIFYPELVHLPGYQPIMFSGRTGMRGGSVGFYIREGLHSNNLSVYQSNCNTQTKKLFYQISIDRRTRPLIRPPLSI